MKKKAFKEILKYVRVIVFFAVITILVEAVNYVMVQPGYARYIIHTVDNPDDGSDYDRHRGRREQDDALYRHRPRGIRQL